jgi:Tfp pilus assembly protein PilF
MRAEQGRVPEAQKLMEKSIRVDLSYVRGYLNLARLYAMQGRRRDAREALEEVLILSPGNAIATNALRSLVQP